MSTAPPRSPDHLIEAEHDTRPPQRRSRPERSYVVCSTPRTGSGLLCRALARSGRAGIPLEYFNHVHRGALTRRWGCEPELDPYLAALHSHRTDADGLFGAKIHWAQLAEVRSEAGAGSDDQSRYETDPALVERLFPNATFVRIARMDLDRQAVSYWRAMGSNLWWVEDAGPETGDTPYDFAGIDHCRRLIERAELCWDRLLRSLGADPVLITYEQLCDDYEATVARVAERIAPGASLPVPPPSTRKLGDQRSELLLDRFRAERRARGVKG